MHAGMPNLPHFQVRVSLLSDAAFFPHLSKSFIKKHPDLVTKDLEGGFKETFKVSFIILEKSHCPSWRSLVKT